MNYIGSKLRLLNFVEEGINKVVKKNNYTFSDLFAGTGIVGRYFKKKGHKVIANDIQYYSYILNRNYIGNHKKLFFSNLESEIIGLREISIIEKPEFVCNFLNNLEGMKGFIYYNYCIGGTKGAQFERQYFSDENGMKCDAIRTKIEYWKSKNFLNEDEYFFLLASLIESIDKVANTIGVYGYFLKNLKNSALKALIIKPAEFLENDHDHFIYNEDTNILIKYTTHDVVYLDPPYNERQYGGNYHLLETISRYDNPMLKGKTGIRDYSPQKSLYCSRDKAILAFKELIENLDAKYIFLSYNDEGLLTLEDIKQIMSSRGKYDFFTKSYNRFKSDKSENRIYKRTKVTEYLHYVIVEK